MSSKNNTGFSFNFKLPSEGLALRSVATENGTPKLIFDAALKTPTLTEEDVGTVCQLACEGVRPEFFYYGIPSHHPYHGRQYKHYSPPKIRGTSIGELLAEADWTMKCLNIGVRSDKTKERFWAWQETSNLEGLADTLDFPRDQLSGSVMMTCDSVEVEETESRMVFIGEPKMKITADSNSCYSKYITDIYPSIAYYDEPLFLKMQELIKLILAMEWLRDKGVRFSRPWMMECSTPKDKKASQTIEVKSKGLREDEIRNMLGNIVKQLPETSHQEVMTPTLGSFTVDTITKKTVTENSIEVKCTTTVVPTSLTSPEVKQTTTIRASVNDYDMLYSGMDQNMPIIPELPGRDNKKIIPNVHSWSELFAETVPWPRIWKLPHDTDALFSTSGGVSTSNIPVRKTVAERAQSHIKVPSREAERVRAPVEQSVHQGPYVAEGNGQLSILAQQGKRKKAEKVPSSMIPSPSVAIRPDNNVTSKTDLTVRNKRGRCDEGVGWEDPGGGQREVYDRRGNIKAEQRSMRSSLHRRTEVNGQVVQDARYGAAMAPTTTTTRIVKTGQQSHKVKNAIKHKKKIAIERGAESKSKALNTSRPVQQLTPSLSHNEQPEQHQQQQVPPPAQVTSDPLSPTASFASSQDSGFASLSDMQQSNLQQAESNKPTHEKENTASATPAHPSTLPLKVQPQAQQQVAMAPPAGVISDLFSPNGSVDSNDSGFGDGNHTQAAERPAHLPHLLEKQHQQVAQPAPVTDLFSPTSSVASKDSGFASVTDGQQNNLADGESSEPAKDKDDGVSDTSSDSGNGSPDEFGDDRMDTD